MPKQVNLEQYKAYLQDVGNIGVRHENTRKFYMSVVSAFFVFMSMAGEDGLLANIRDNVLFLVGLVGIVLCIAWAAHMQSFGALYRAKFDVLRVMESEHDLFHVFDEEYSRLRENPRYYLLTALDTVTPVLFLGLFIALLHLK